MQNLKQIAGIKSFVLHRKEKNTPVKAANAEISAMAELSDNDIQELVRITSIFSKHMKNKFSEIREDEK